MSKNLKKPVEFDDLGGYGGSEIEEKSNKNSDAKYISQQVSFKSDFGPSRGPSWSPSWGKVGLKSQSNISVK